MPPPAADLPDPLVLARPVVADPVHQPAEVFPSVVAEGRAVLVEQVDGVHQLAVDVELQLAVGGVADPHRARAAIALQVRQLLLDQIGPAVDAVHQLQGTVASGLVLVPAGGQPVHEPGRLLGEADPHQGVQGEGGVAHPGVAVVPVPHAADALGQAGGRRGDDGPGRLVGQQLERQGRALHDLAPAAVVGAVGQPALPVRDGLPEPLLRLVGAGAVADVVAGVELAQDEGRALSLAQDEIGQHAVAIPPQRDRGSQPQAQPRSVEAGALLGDGRVVPGAGVVEGGPALQAERQPAAARPGPGGRAGRPGVRRPHRRACSPRSRRCRRGAGSA